MAQTIKNQLARQETWVQALGWEDPLKEGITTPSVFLPGENPWTEEPGELQSTGSQGQDTTDQAHSTHIHHITHLY